MVGACSIFAWLATSRDPHLHHRCFYDCIVLSMAVFHRPKAVLRFGSGQAPTGPCPQYQSVESPLAPEIFAGPNFLALALLAARVRRVSVPPQNFLSAARDRITKRSQRSNFPPAGRLRDKADLTPGEASSLRRAFETESMASKSPIARTAAMLGAAFRIVTSR